METECEVFLFLVLLSLAILMIFMGTVCIIEYIFYRIEYKRFLDKFKNK